MSILNSIRNLQDYADNPKNGYMDNVFLDIIQQKKRLGKSLSQEEQKFLEQKNKDANALAVVGSEIAKDRRKDRLILAISDLNSLSNHVLSVC